MGYVSLQKRGITSAPRERGEITSAPRERGMGKRSVPIGVWGHRAEGDRVSPQCDLKNMMYVEI